MKGQQYRPPLWFLLVGTALVLAAFASFAFLLAVIAGLVGSLT